MIAHWLRVFAAVAALVLLTPASAWAVSSTYCVNYEQLYYQDSGSGNQFTGETVPAHGAMLRFVHGGTVLDYWLDAGGATPGCKVISLSNSHPWEVRLVRKAKIGTNYINVTNNGIIPYSIVLHPSLTPSAGATYDNDDWNLVWSDSIQIMAVASYALTRENAGVNGVTYTFVTDPCPINTDTSCWYPSDGWIYLNWEATPAHQLYKFVIAHELGHAISDAADEDPDDGLATNYNASVDDCTPMYSNPWHQMNSKEYNSAAAVEGIAHYYAALAFNDYGYADDCEYQTQGGPDWDASGTANAPDVSVFSCANGVEYFGGEVADGHDYLGDFCLASGQTSNRGVEYDWLRLFWDLTTYAGLSVHDVYAIWGAADPHDWNASGNGTGPNYPAARMSHAAYLYGITISDPYLQATYDLWAAVEGTDR